LTRNEAGEAGGELEGGMKRFLRDPFNVWMTLFVILMIVNFILFALRNIDLHRMRVEWFSWL